MTWPSASLMARCTWASATKTVAVKALASCGAKTDRCTLGNGRMASGMVRAHFSSRMECLRDNGLTTMLMGLVQSVTKTATSLKVNTRTTKSVALGLTRGKMALRRKATMWMARGMAGTTCAVMGRIGTSSMRRATWYLQVNEAAQCYLLLLHALRWPSPSRKIPQFLNLLQLLIKLRLSSQVPMLLNLLQGSNRNRQGWQHTPRTRFRISWAQRLSRDSEGLLLSVLPVLVNVQASRSPVRAFAQVAGLWPAVGVQARD
mmetsp:Transcript_9138/g.16670  ORF Transcript_9138/g.16670 Transcript_9138/m.16670 type:complete len:260 (+) Transcript_9138:1809-2588(+)